MRKQIFTDASLDVNDEGLRRVVGRAELGRLNNFKSIADRSCGRGRRVFVF